MFGISWGGFNSLQVAALRPPAPKAIVTSCSSDDRYANDMHCSGSCLLNDNLDWGTTFFSIRPLPGDPEIMGKGLAQELGWSAWKISPAGPSNGWATRRAMRSGSMDRCARITVASSARCLPWAAGLDGHTDAIPRLLKNLKVPLLSLIGPHAHQWGQ